jgi:hypothetical protein
VIIESEASDTCDWSVSFQASYTRLFSSEFDGSCSVFSEEECLAALSTMLECSCCCSR